MIFTLPEDRLAIEAAPIFRLLQKYADPVIIEIPPCPTDVSACVHMGASHRYGCVSAYEDDAYPFVFQPDSVFSDGIIARLQDLASQGVQLVLVPALRFEEEAFFNQLEQMGVSPSKHGNRAAPIQFESRKLTSMALNSMHSETKTYEWDAPYFCLTPSAVWWRVPDEDGIVVNCFSWAAPLFDFRAVPKLDTATFDNNWTIDGDFIYRNLGNIDRVHLVLDSDEMFIASWAPSADKPYDMTPKPYMGKHWIGNLRKMDAFNSIFHSGILYDPLRQAAFFHLVRWHGKAIDDRQWRPVEKQARKRLLAAVGPLSAEITALYCKLGSSSNCSSLRESLPQLAVARALLALNMAMMRACSRMIRAYQTLKFYARHYSVQGPAYARYYAYRLLHFGKHHLIQGLAKARYYFYVSRHFVRHYVIQGVAHIRYYRYRFSFFVRHSVAQVLSWLSHYRYRASGYISESIKSVVLSKRSVKVDDPAGHGYNSSPRSDPTRPI